MKVSVLFFSKGRFWNLAEEKIYCEECAVVYNLFMLGGMKCEKILVSEESDDPSSVHGAGRRWRCIVKYQTISQKREVSTEEISEEYLIPGGMPIGIYMETNGVMVLGTDAIEGTDGDKYKPADHNRSTGRLYYRDQ